MDISDNSKVYNEKDHENDIKNKDNLAYVETIDEKETNKNLVDTRIRYGKKPIYLPSGNV